jgi:MFS family permease
MFKNRFSALQHRDFRIFWFGYVISVSGQQMLWMLEPWLIYELTGSKIALGGFAVAQAIPATALVLVGGVIADKFDQRKLLIMVQIGNIVLLGLLAGLALIEVLELWHILAIAFVHSAVGSFENPARQSMFPHLVDHASMPNAIGLNSSIHPGTRIGAPVVGGLVLKLMMDMTGSPRIAAGTVLLITVAGISIYTVMLMKIHLPPIKRAYAGSMLKSMAEGARFIWHERIFAFLIGLAWYTMFFGISFTILLPVIAKDILHVGPGSLGFMWGAQGIGSMAGVIISSYYARPGQQRRTLILAPILLGGAMVALAVTPIYWVSLFIFFLVGTGASAGNVAVQQNLQMLVPAELRGRVMGVWSIVHTSIRPMGELQFTGIAVFSAPLALIVSGAMLIAASVFYIAPSKQSHNLKDLRQAAVDSYAERASSR